MSLSSLPSELVVRIISFLSDHLDVINVGRTAREPNLCSLEPVVWRSLTLHRWKYSKTSHSSASLAFDWRTEYIRRFQLDQHIDDTVEKLTHQPDPPNWARVPRFREVKDWGLDGKDAILRHIGAPDTLDDVLARRYWARALLTSLYRRQAVEEWQKIVAGEEVPLERALTTFDLFISDGEAGDFEYVSDVLDEMSQDFRKTVPDWQTLSTRGLALQLAQYLINIQGFSGNSQENYYDITNNFISLTLQSPSRAGMPLIYVAIYCAIASRLGLNAQPCSFPSHVFAVIQPPDGFNLNGKVLPEHAPKDRMYVDLYSLTTLEIGESNLQTIMSEMGLPDAQHQQYLAPVSTAKMVLRMRRNLMHSLQLAANDAANDERSASILGVYREELVYMILWMTMLFDADDPNGYERRASHLNYLVPRMEELFIGDWYLLREVITPMFRGRDEERLIVDSTDGLRQRDLTPPAPKRRSDDIRGRILFKVGTCFSHKKYGYVGIIVGWDAECMAPSSWQATQGIADLDDGPNQCFYNAKSEDGMDRYVAQENIGPMPPSGPTDEIMRMAGKFFLRWDKSAKRFISNLKREYPDD